jgi:hypothetical protein
MTTLAKNASRTFVPWGTDISDLPVIAADIIYEGAAVGDDGNGHVRPLVAGDPFRGFALDKFDNSAGAAAAVNAHVRIRGQIQLPVASAAITDVGKAVYASDDDTFVLTQSTNSYIGRIARFVSSGVAIVAFDTVNPPVAELGALLDSTTGTPATTLVDVTGTPTQATINANFASLAAKYNALERMVRGS